MIELWEYVAEYGFHVARVALFVVVVLLLVVLSGMSGWNGH